MWEFLKQLTNPESIIQYGGLALLLFVIFAETGLMLGFFYRATHSFLLQDYFAPLRPNF